MKQGNGKGNKTGQEDDENNANTYKINIGKNWTKKTAPLGSERMKH